MTSMAWRSPSLQSLILFHSTLLFSWLRGSSLKHICLLYSDTDTGSASYCRDDLMALKKLQFKSPHQIILFVLLLTSAHARALSYCQCGRLGLLPLSISCCEGRFIFQRILRCWHVDVLIYLLSTFDTGVGWTSVSKMHLGISGPFPWLSLLSVGYTRWNSFRHSIFVVD